MPGGPAGSAARWPAAGSPAESSTWRWQGERAALPTAAGLQLPSLSLLPPPPRCHPSARGLLLSQGHGSRKPLNAKIFPNCSLFNFFFLPLSVGFFFPQQHPTPHASEVKNRVPSQQGGSSAVLCWRADLFFSQAF